MREALQQQRSYKERVWKFIEVATQENQCADLAIKFSYHYGCEVLLGTMVHECHNFLLFLIFP